MKKHLFFHLSGKYVNHGLMCILKSKSISVLFLYVCKVVYSFFYSNQASWAQKCSMGSCYLISESR